MITPTWFMVYVVVIGVAVVLQLGVLIALYLGFRDMQVKLQALMDRDLQPLLSSARSLVDHTRKQVDRLSETLEELSETARAQMAKVDQVMTEATDRARLQLIRVDELVADTLNRMEQMVDHFQKSVSRPVRELQAVLHGIRTALEFLVGRRGRPTPERATQDEELFI